MNFDYGNVLTSAWQITLKHKSIWGLMMLPMLVSFLPFVLFFIPFLVFIGGGETEVSETTTAIFAIVFILIFVVSMIANFVIGSASISAATLGIVRAERGEGSTKFMDLIRDGIAYFWRVLGVMLVVNLTLGLIFTLFFMLSFVLIIVTIGLAAICMQPIMLLLTPLMFLVVGVLEAALTAVISENMSVMDSVKHALRVVRAHVWKYVIITLIVYFGGSILTSFIIVPMMLPAFFIPFLLESGQELSTQSVILISSSFTCIFIPLMVLISGLIGVFMKTALDLTYLRLTGQSEAQVMHLAENPQVDGIN